MKCIVLKPTSSNFTILFSFPMPKSIPSDTFYAISFQFCNIRSCCPFGNCKPFGNFLVLDRWVIYYKSKSVKNFLSAIFRQSFGKCNETPIAFYRVIVFCIIFSAICIIIRPRQAPLTTRQNVEALASLSFSRHSRALLIWLNENVPFRNSMTMGTFSSSS